MSAPALLSRHLARQEPGGRGTAAHLLASHSTATVLALCAAGEMVIDKTPWVPDRTEAPSLAGRALSGALAGAAVAGTRGGSRVGAALLGSAAAIGASYLAYALRKEGAERTDAPDAVLGLLEDTIVGAAGWCLLRTAR